MIEGLCLGFIIGVALAAFLRMRSATVRRSKLRVIEAIGADELPGLAIARRSGLRTAILYSVLARLEDEGILTARWEDGDPARPDAPRRRLYRVRDYFADDRRIT